MRLMTSLRWNAGQTFRGLKSTGSDFVMSVMLAGLALTLPFFIACVWLSVADLSFSMPKTEVTVFTERTASLASVKKIQRNINDLAGVAETRLLTREKALELVNQNLGVKDRGNTNNTLPDIIIVTVGSNMSSAATAELDTAIKKIPGVVSTAFDAEWAENLARFQSAAWSAALILGAVILLLCVLVIMSSIRMTTRAQNEEIRALNTFGAEVGFIAAPYGWRGAITLTAADLRRRLRRLGLRERPLCCVVRNSKSPERTNFLRSLQSFTNPPPATKTGGVGCVFPSFSVFKFAP